MTGDEGDGQAVLLRAVAPVDGLDVMRLGRRGRPDRDLANGPAQAVRRPSASPSPTTAARRPCSTTASLDRPSRGVDAADRDHQRGPICSGAGSCQADAVAIGAVSGSESRSRGGGTCARCSHGPSPPRQRTIESDRAVLGVGRVGPDRQFRDQRRALGVRPTRDPWRRRRSVEFGDVASPLLGGEVVEHPASS